MQKSTASQPEELNYDADWAGWRDIVFIAIFQPFLILVVALRFHARSLTKSKLDIGDFLVVLSLVCQLIASGVYIGSIVQAGVGHHFGYVIATHPEQVTPFFKYLVFFSVWYFATVTLPKLAVCQLYRTLFPQRPVKIVLFITVAVLIATPIATTTALLAACRPFSANWGSTEEQNEHCYINKDDLYVYGSIPNIVTDIVLLIMPLPIVWGLQAARKIKVALTVTFLVGSAGLVTSIFRFISFKETNAFVDATYASYTLIFWTSAEQGAYLTTACMLMFRPLLEKAKVGSISSIITPLSSPYALTPRSRGTKNSNFNDDSRPFSKIGDDMDITLVPTSGLGGSDQRINIEGNARNESPEQRIVITTNIQQAWSEV
ncbi:putative alpha-xylosidase [Xylariaceae sp. FL0255]|nr:putative alpha-xylosidase [Xylariaceae sp. FL0255]